MTTRVSTLYFNLRETAKRVGLEMTYLARRLKDG